MTVQEPYSIVTQSASEGPRWRFGLQCCEIVRTDLVLRLFPSGRILPNGDGVAPLQPGQLPLPSFFFKIAASTSPPPGRADYMSSRPFCRPERVALPNHIV